MSRWTTADPSGFPDGVNNMIYSAIPTLQFDALGLNTETVTNYSSAQPLSLNTGITTIPSGWSSLEITPSGGGSTSFSTFQPVLNSVLGSQTFIVGLSATYDYTSGMFSSSSETYLSSGNQGGSQTISGTVSGVNGTQTGTYTIGNIKLTQTGTITVVNGSFVPYNSNPFVDASIKYRVPIQANWSESASLSHSSASATATPQQTFYFDITVYE